MRTLALLLLFTLLGGCGQMGPLYMPDESPQAQPHERAPGDATDD